MVPDYQLQNIVENEDGSVTIRFGSERSIKIDPFEGSRRSTSHTSQREFVGETSRRSMSSLEGFLKTTDQLNGPVYKVETPPEIPRDQSPTPSDMGYSEGSVLVLGNKDYVPNKQKLKELFESKENKKI